MMVTATLFRDYLDLLKAAATEAGLPLTTMLGYPEADRALPTLPIAALAFAKDEYAAAGKVYTLGRSQPHGTELGGTLLLMAENEYQLLQLVDFFRTVKGSAEALIASDDVFVVAYGPTQRVGSGESDALHHAAETTVAFRQQLHP